VTDAADHLGAAAGALAIGVVLLPVLGITASCVLLAALKAFGLLLLAGAGPDAGNPRAA
jgi:predicted membrane-bound spermidine synthase